MNYVMFVIKPINNKTEGRQQSEKERWYQDDDDDCSWESRSKIQPPYEAICGSIIKSIIIA